MKKTGVNFGMQYLTEGEYEVRSGRGNKVVGEMKVEDGVLYIKEKDDWIRCYQTKYS